MDKQLIDDCFYVVEKRYGTFDSFDKEGKCIITSLTEEECVRSTRWYLKQLQETAFDKLEEKTYTSEVGGKL
jgi:hypothetical protein